MDIFPSSFWVMLYHWEPSISLLLSLCMQLALLPMGLMRKRTSNQFLRLFLLFAYSFADWITSFSFGILVEKYGSGCYDEFTDPTYIIRALLAPFLLLHLGGSDTITAYSMEDKELWLRTLLPMLDQLLASFYLFLLALQPTSLKYVAIPIFVAGIIKYGEKIWALRTASAERLRDFVAVSTPSTIITHDQEELKDVQMLHTAYHFFNKDKRMFVGLGPTSFDRHQNGLSYYEEFNSKLPFKIIELELGFMYDFFYTKTSINHSRRGLLFLLITFSSLVIAIVTYCMIDKQPKDTSEHVLELLQDKKLGRKSSMLKNMELKIEVNNVEKEQRNNKSMLLDGCRLARQLEEIEESKKWEIIGNVWMELLGRISCECEWYDHAKHLTQGGNLLTRVWILMHHLGYVKPSNVFTMEEDQPLLDHEILPDYVLEQMFDVIFNIVSL
ncbi:uncharacterized protein LOC120072067 [Benincasa hispida]|uniref:uncharacterized protein LOC120072067 n=1 Tax=Benincasa hispida TaxID=102211 RepID=UPI0018FF1C73|nr:uncharacterized protein LOC120072067 [Benincasa hispida]